MYCDTRRKRNLASYIWKRLDWSLVEKKDKTSLFPTNIYKENIMKRVQILFCLLLLTSLAVGQDTGILPGQKNAIKNISSGTGFSADELENYLVQNYGKSIDELTRTEGAAVISAFQSGSVSKPATPAPRAPVSKQKPGKKVVELELAEYVEVGMSKRFHFRDGTVREGTIKSVSDGKAELETLSGTFQIPTDQFLSERAEIINRKGERYKGIVIGETVEEFILRTDYGDAVINKRSIQSMKRYHGGVLERETEERRRFYQSEEQVVQVFMDPNAFILEPNTFYLSGLSIGYGLSERFMLKTEFGSSFSGDLNFETKHQIYQKKSAEKQSAMAWGVNVHRARSVENIVSRYSHAIVDIATNTPLNELDSIPSISDDVLLPTVTDEEIFSIELMAMFSSRRTNPSGRGKMGWTLGAKASPLDFMNRNDWIDSTKFSWDSDPIYKIPFRVWGSLEYDLRKNLKFLAIAWVDNGWKTMTFGEMLDDYSGKEGAAFSLDSPKGSVSLIDFDFGFQYAINENLRLGVHFQQPFLDLYWKFLEF